MLRPMFGGVAGLLLALGAQGALAQRVPPTRVPPSGDPWARRPGGSGPLAPQPPSMMVLKPGGLSKAEFRSRLNALRPEQLVEWQGKPITKLEFFSRAGRRISEAHHQAAQAAAARHDLESELADVELSAARTHFEVSEAGKLAARNNQARSAARQRIAEHEAAGSTAGAAGTDGAIAPPPHSPLPAPLAAQGAPAAPVPSTALAASPGLGLSAAPAASGAGTPADPAGPCSRPQIAFAPPDPLVPGSWVVVLGCAFGKAGGKAGAGARLSLLLPAAGVEVPLEIEDWHDRWITAIVPAGLTRLEDQGTVLVVRAPAGESAGWPVPYHAARELRALRSAEVKVSNCAETADCNYCNGVSHADPAYWGLLDSSGLGNPAGGTASIGAYHADDASPAEDRGADVYRVHLGHGWTLSGVAFHFDPLSGGEAAPPQGFEAGYADQTLIVPWRIPADGGIAYSIDVFATGPRGVQP